MALIGALLIYAAVVETVRDVRAWLRGGPR